MGKDRIRSVRDMRVWQIGMDISIVCYKLTKRFPKYELYGLTSQIRRAAVSVPRILPKGSVARTGRTVNRGRFVNGGGFVNGGRFVNRGRLVNRKTRE